MAQGIDSISLNPDSVLKTMLAIVDAEKVVGRSAAAEGQSPTPGGEERASVASRPSVETNR